MQIKIIELKDVSKKYAFINRTDSDFKDFWALKGVSLDIYNGQIIGIIGRNGAGKTTLLKIIAGILTFTEGRVLTNGKVVGLFNLGIGFQDELTGRENIFFNGAIMGATRQELDNKLDSIIEFSELGSFIDMPLGSYSQGMKLRLGFSIIANLDFDVLVIDEVLAVGDVLFQSKCFERLMDFKRAGKTLIITTQNIGLIERLCDEAVLLDHGSLVCHGNPVDTINKYQALLNTEKFFVGPKHKEDMLVENTKKWADGISDWGKKIGTKEAEIESVEFINRFGFKVCKIRTGKYLKIKVNFYAKDKINKPHFGVAIFRDDGVYGYGPNTDFDRCRVKDLRPGKGYFTLTYRNIILAPGNYRVSVAIWDKNEKLAFDYHDGYYKLKIIGNDSLNKQLLNIPYEIMPGRHNFQALNSIAVKLFDALGREKYIFTTNQPVKLAICATYHNIKEKFLFLLIDIYRDDGIHCQSIQLPFKKDNSLTVFFAKMPLLPGSYSISAGIYDSSQQRFLIRQDNICFFRMVFNRHDHGTVYLEHSWHWGS